MICTSDYLNRPTVPKLIKVLQVRAVMPMSSFKSDNSNIDHIFVLKTLADIYLNKQTKSCVNVSGTNSEYFSCNVGV